MIDRKLHSLHIETKRLSFQKMSKGIQETQYRLKARLENYWSLLSKVPYPRLYSEAVNKRSRDYQLMLSWLQFCYNLQFCSEDTRIKVRAKKMLQSLQSPRAGCTVFAWCDLILGRPELAHHYDHHLTFLNEDNYGKERFMTCSLVSRNFFLSLL